MRRRRRIIANAPVLETERERNQRLRRENVAARLRTISERERGRRKLTLAMKLEQAGLRITVRQFHLASAAAAGGVALAIFSVVGPVPAIPAAICAFIAIPRIALSKLRARRQAAFVAELPNLLDSVARAVKAGLTLDQAVVSATASAKSPLRRNSSV